MDKDLKEALEAIKALRAALWLAYDEGDGKEADTHMGPDARDAFYDAQKILAKHNDPDDMMDVDMDGMLPK